ncbi:MAG: hypothetical protein IT289_10025 [Oligoflexia bacterium]|nr:hypothetical protein [Oligoflexia bacterium]
MTWLFAPDHVASVIHVNLKLIHALSIFLLLSTTRSFKAILVFASVSGIAGVYISNQIGHLTIYYKFWLNYLLPVLSVLSVIDNYSTKEETRQTLTRKIFSITWGLCHLLTASQFSMGTSNFSWPLVVAISVVAVLYLATTEWVTERKFLGVVSTILSTIKDESRPKEGVMRIARMAFEQTKFKRLSVYIDSYCLGQTTNPQVQMTRVMEYGYQKDTTQDAEILFSENQGQVMLEALKSGKEVLRQGPKNDWFLVVPIGPHACFNFSNDSETENYIAFESAEAIKKILPALQTISQKLVDHAVRNTTALGKLKSILGSGQHPATIGSVFVDINNFTKNIERYGEAYGNFVSHIYIPSLIRAVQGLLSLEFTRGDEAYFVAINELLPSQITVAEGTLKGIEAIDHFAKHEGANLCKEHGYDVLTISTGANVGEATIICDELSVRTSGRVVNEAKRLQQGAGKGQILVHNDFVEKHSVENDLYWSESFPILFKKNQINARRLIGKKNQSKVS